LSAKLSVTLVLALLWLTGSGCGFSSKSEVKFVVTTPIGRKELTTRRYTLKEIAAGVSTAAAKSPFDLQHPIYPDRNQFEQLKAALKDGGHIWYFEGLDSGLAVIKNRAVIWVLVTDHEY
jgi:hypothetical protein